MNNHITVFSDHLYLIELKPPLPGFDHFISTWVYKGEHTFIVDVGPSITAPQLIEALASLHIHALDYILLTHIHIDHGGGLGDIADHFKDTPIVCHEGGIPHMVSPERLYRGSVKTLGKTAETYGPIKPVPEHRFIPAQAFSQGGIVPIITPGHAPHHVSYMKDNYLFAGEAGGVSLPVQGPEEYLRPATPPRFFLDTYVKSIDTLIEAAPHILCYGHFGLKENGPAMLEQNKSQLFLWRDLIGDRIAHKEKDPDWYETVIRLVLDKDPSMAGFSHLDEPVQAREKGFIKNAIMGFEGYLKDR